MVGRKKKPKLCDKVSGEDRLSQLPDALLSEILSHLSTKDAVRTSALSTRWTNLWQCVPALDLSRDSFRNFDAFTRFVYRVLDSDSWIRKLRLHIIGYSHAKRSIPGWIDDVTTRRIQHLDVKCLYAFKIPQSLYTWEALVHLQLYGASFAINAEFVCLPSLKILNLENLRDPNKAMLQKLISGSPVLEDLKIISVSTDDGNVLQVCSHTLKRIEIHMLTVMIDAPSLVHLNLHDASLPYVDFVSFPCMKIMHLVLDEVEDSSETALQKFISGSPVLEELRIVSFSTDTTKDLQIFSQTVKRIEIIVSNKVVIDAPLLEYLGAGVSSTDTFEIINLGISAKLYIAAVSEDDETFNSNAIHEIFTNILKVRDLVISNDFWKDIFLYTKSGPVLQFGDLSRLHAKFYEFDLEMLPTILESCPKLESLILTMIEVLYMSHKKKKKKKEEAKVMFSTVPQCLVSSLKFVELKRSKKSPGHEGETELIRYLLKNATMLQTLKLDIYYPEKAKRGFHQELLTMPRCSSACEIQCSFDT